MSSDDEPVFMTMKDAKERAMESGILNKKIMKTKKKPAPKKAPLDEIKINAPNKVAFKEDPKPEVPTTIKSSILDMINEELPTKLLKAIDKEKEKPEYKLKMLREKGETKTEIIEKAPKIKRKKVDNIEVVFVKKDFVPKGDPEHAAKAQDFLKNIFNRSSAKRVPLSKILTK